MDLFATDQNNKCQLFCSWGGSSQGALSDALLISWIVGLMCIFPHDTNRLETESRCWTDGHDSLRTGQIALEFGCGEPLHTTSPGPNISPALTHIVSQNNYQILHWPGPRFIASDGLLVGWHPLKENVLNFSRAAFSKSGISHLGWLINLSGRDFLFWDLNTSCLPWQHPLQQYYTIYEPWKKIWTFF